MKNYPHDFTMARNLLVGFASYFCSIYSSYGASDIALAPLSNIGQEAKIIASVKIGDGHTVVFHELSSGIISVTETAKIYQPRLLVGNIESGMSMTDIYRMVQPNDKVPDSLVSAEARLAELHTKAPLLQMSKPPQIDAGGKGPHPYNAGEQVWFKQTFCHDRYGQDSLVNCVQAFQWITSGWQRGAIFTFDTMVGSEGRDTAKIDTYYWNGTQEVLLAVDTVSPGWVSTRGFFYYQPFWWHVNLEGPSGNVNTQVSQDIKTCGNGGQWACSRNCAGSIACNAENTTFCQIVGGNGESWCNSR